MEFLEFDSPTAASAAAAVRISKALLNRLQAQGSASLVVSGGSTPAECLQQLAQQELDWSAVHVFLSDERWVPADSTASNAGMIERQLLRDKASAAKLHPVYQADVSTAERCVSLEAEIRESPFPFASVLLGMGADGHFASLFPDAEQLESSLDPDHPQLCVPVETAASEHQRISLTMAALSRSDEILLLIFGSEKRATLESAIAGNLQLPVARLVRQKMAPVSVYWAPEEK